MPELVTIADILARHRDGGSPEDTIRAVYARIAAHADPALFITLRPEADARADAVRLEAEGQRDLPLWGVPFVVKDNIDVAGLPTTAACPAFAYMPTESAEVVRRLLAAGAIVIGKTNLDQFATGLVGVRSPHGVPRNALRADLVPGGSSSGSAAAVGAGIVPFSLGTDTAGSGRIPAGMNGIVGLKPTRGALSLSGVVPACKTIDCVSIFALDVADAFAAFAVASGYDPKDGWSRPVPAQRMGVMPLALKVGVPRADQRLFFGDGAAERAFAADLERLANLGASILEIDFEPFYAAARLLYEGPWVAERYSAARALIDRDPDALHPVTRAIIAGGAAPKAVEAFEATYKLADLKRAADIAMAGLDCLAVPTLPALYTVAALEADPIRLNSNLGTYTNFANFFDLAGLAVPSGMRADGHPSGVTLLAPAGSDGYLAGIGAALQAESGVPMGATGVMPSKPASGPLRAAPGHIEIAVVGAHLSGMPLNHQLRDLGGVFLRAVETVPAYRFYALPGTVPPKPGLLRVAEGGASIAAEVWSLDPAGFGTFVAAIPSPLGIGTLAFTDGTACHGFLVEPTAVVDAPDISHFGGWRGYMAAKGK